MSNDKRTVVDVEQLQDAGACPSIVALFERDFPNGAPVPTSSKEQVQLLIDYKSARRGWAWAVAQKIIPSWSMAGADLHGADLRGADLRWADLRWADLHRADLHGADLRGADLRWADLRWADLHRAYLCEANLRCANLREANLHGAYLRGAYNVPDYVDQE